MILACLLHDASEAYISDIIRPVKVHLANYLEIEEMIMNVIWKKFNLDDLSSEENAMWKQIDNDILSAELPVLFPGEKEIEEMIMNVIWKKFNLDDLSSEENAMWKQIDNDILSAELPVLFPGEKNHRSAALQSSPDLIEHPFHDIEER